MGGHCIAVDPWCLASASPNNSPLIQTARKVNNRKSIWVYEQILNEINYLEKFLKRKIKVGCFGISYKPDIDDLRESAAIKIINMLIKKNIDVMINDPNIYEYKNYKMFSIKDVCKKCDVNVFLVRHKEYMK